MMNSRKKIVIAAMLAAVLALTGCNTDNERSNAFSNDDGYSSVSTVSEPVAPSHSSSETTTATESVTSSQNVADNASSKSETTTTETSAHEPSEPETSSVSVPAEPESTSDKDDFEKRIFEALGEKTIGELMSDVEEQKERSAKADKRSEEEKLVDALIDELELNDDKKSDMEKLCILGKWFCDNTEYDYALAESDDTGKGNEVSYLLINHSGICSSYAKVACLILYRCGIDTLYCKSDNINHAWNAVKIDGQWIYTDFVGGPDTLMLGSSRHGVPKDTLIRWHTSHHGYGYSGEIPDISEISNELRLFDFNGNEFEVHVEADGYSYVDENGGTRKYTF